MTRTKTTLTTIMTLSLAAGCGHSSSSDGDMLAAGSTIAPISTSLFEGEGIPQQGPSVIPGPRVDVVTPARGAVVQGQTVRVEGVVTDLGTGVGQVRINGVDVPANADGAFAADVDVTPGVNTIVVEGYDQAGGRTERQVSVLAGALVAESQALQNAASIRLTDAAFDRVEAQAGRQVEANKAQLAQQVLAQNIPDTTLTSFDFGRVLVFLDCATGGLRFEARIADVALGMETRVRQLIGSTTLRGTVRAQEVRLQGTILVSVQNGQPVAQVNQIQATTTGFSVPDYAAGERDNIRQAFESNFASSTARGVQEAMADAFTQSSGTERHETLGYEVDASWNMTSLAFDEDGATANFEVNLAAVSPVYGQAMGSVTTQTEIAKLVGGDQAGPNVAAVVHQDLINRGLYAAWRAGAMDFTLDQATLDALQPNAPAMDTTTLIYAAPALGAVLPAGLPVDMEIEALLPPTVHTTPQAAGLFLVRMGAIKVTTFVTDPTQGRVKLSDAVYALEAPVSLQVQGQEIRLVAAGDPTVHVDVEGRSLPGTEQTLESMISGTVGQTFGATLAAAQGVTLPEAEGGQISNLSFMAFGQSLVGLGFLQVN